MSLRIRNLLPPQVSACELELVFVYLLKLVDHVCNPVLNFQNKVLAEALAQTHEKHAEGAVHFGQLHKKLDRDLCRVGRQRLDFLFQAVSQLQLSVVGD